MEKLLDKGQTLSPELLNSISADHRHRSPLPGGIFISMVGLAIMIFFWALTGGSGLWDGVGAPVWLPVLGVFPLLIGIAMLLSALLDRRREP